MGGVGVGVGKRRAGAADGLCEHVEHRLANAMRVVDFLPEKQCVALPGTPPDIGAAHR